MVAYYQHKIAKWMDGTDDLSDGEYRVYHVICQLIYLHDGPITNNERGLAGKCKQHILAFRRNFKKLVERGKLVVAGGKISNQRAETELKYIQNHRQTPSEPPANPPPIQGESGGDRRSKPLKNRQGILFAAPLEKSRVDSEEPNGSSAVDLEKQFFDRGKEMFGNAAGGFLVKLLKAKDGDVRLARAALEQASTKQDPREFIGAILRGPAPRKGGNAFARMAARTAIQDGEDDGENASGAADRRDDGAGSVIEYRALPYRK